MPDPPDHAVRQGEPDAEEKGVGHEGDQEDGPRKHQDDAEVSLPLKKIPKEKDFEQGLAAHWAKEALLEPFK